MNDRVEAGVAVLAQEPGQRVWFFERLSPSETIVAVEPNGRRHVIKNGNMNTIAGRDLLNAMAEALTNGVDSIHGASRAPHFARQSSELEPNDERRNEEGNRSLGKEGRLSEQGGRRTEVLASSAEPRARSGDAVQHEVEQEPGPRAPAVTDGVKGLER